MDKYDIIVDETDLNKLRQKGIPEDEQRRNLMVKEYFFCKKYKKQIEEDKEIAEELPNRNQSDAGTTDSDQ